MFSFIFFSCFSHHLSEVCDRLHLGTVFIYRRCGAAFIFVRAIQTSKIYSINNKKSNR